MFEHGTIIGDGMLAVNIYNFFVYYFENPVMKRFQEDTNGFVLFGCKIQSHLSVNSKYIIVSVEASKAPRGAQVTLDQIDWKNLQTRTLDAKLAVPTHRYSQKSDELSNAEIKVVEKSDSIYRYQCKKFSGLDIALLFSKSQTRVYADVGTMKTAIETYNTVFAV